MLELKVKLSNIIKAFKINDLEGFLGVMLENLKNYTRKNQKTPFMQCNPLSVQFLRGAI